MHRNRFLSTLVLGGLLVTAQCLLGFPLVWASAGPPKPGVLPPIYSPPLPADLEKYGQLLEELAQPATKGDLGAAEDRLTSQLTALQKAVKDLTGQLAALKAELSDQMTKQSVQMTTQAVVAAALTKQVDSVETELTQHRLDSAAYTVQLKDTITQGMDTVNTSLNSLTRRATDAGRRLLVTCLMVAANGKLDNCTASGWTGWSELVDNSFDVPFTGAATATIQQGLHN